MRTPPIRHEHEHTHLSIGVTHSHPHHHSGHALPGGIPFEDERHHATRHAHAADHAGLVLPEATHMKDGRALMADVADIGLMVVEQLERLNATMAGLHAALEHLRGASIVTEPPVPHCPWCAAELPPGPMVMHIVRTHGSQEGL